MRKSFNDWMEENVIDEAERNTPVIPTDEQEVAGWDEEEYREQS